MDQTQASQAAAHMFAVLIPMILMFWLVGAAIVIIPFWQIFKKAGLSPALSLLMIVPAINLVMIYVLAFSEWRVVPLAQLGYPSPYPQPYPPQAYPPPAPYPPQAAYQPVPPQAPAPVDPPNPTEV